MQGRIIKGIAGAYSVLAEDGLEYECKPKGIFRKEKKKPLVGDRVWIEVLDSDLQTGLITNLCERTSELIRPAVANADQAVVVFAAAAPEPNLNLLDRFLVLMRRQQLKTLICFNKLDLVSSERRKQLKEIYSHSGNRVLFLCAKEKEGIIELQEELFHKVSVLAGPSGVGKSTIVNLLAPESQMETGAVSEKIKRGKHTTRHSELIEISEGTYLFDTPGFSSLFVEDMEKEELKEYYAEFQKYEDQCRFSGCVHLNEPGCAVKDALKKGEFSRERYESYCLIYQELKERKRY